MIGPDPNSPLREIDRIENQRNPIFPNKSGPQICTFLVAQGGAGGGCSSPAQLFSRSPVSAGELLPEGGDEFEYVSGLVSDDVHRLTILLSTGEQIAIPLLDNVFIAQVNRSGFPLRLVAYDRAGKRIDVQTLRDDGGGSTAGPALAPGAKWRTLLRATSASGKRAKVLIAPKRGGGVCASFEVSEAAAREAAASSRGAAPP
jgi:hypothetical protein